MESNCKHIKEVRAYYILLNKSNIDIFKHFQNANSVVAPEIGMYAVNFLDNTDKWFYYNKENFNKEFRRSRL